MQPNWKCLDLGGGSGFLSLFIANLVTDGSVTCYEIKKEHAHIIKENIEIKAILVKSTAILLIIAGIVLVNL